MCQHTVTCLHVSGEVIQYGTPKLQKTESKFAAQHQQIKNTREEKK